MNKLAKTGFAVAAICVSIPAVTLYSITKVQGHLQRTSVQRHDNTPVSTAAKLNDLETIYRTATSEAEASLLVHCETAADSSIKMSVDAKVNMPNYYGVYAIPQPKTKPAGKNTAPKTVAVKKSERNDIADFLKTSGYDLTQLCPQQSRKIDAATAQAARTRADAEGAQIATGLYNQFLKATAPTLN